MRAIVTGGRGFIGSHLVEALVERGDDVIVYDDCRSGDNYCPGAVYFDRPVSEIPPRPVDVIFHLAAIGRTPAAIADPVECWRVNTLGAVEVLEAARQAKVGRVVLSSSNIVYAAETPYKASKLAMERAAMVYTGLYGVSTICLRYANTYGPRQSEEGIGPNVFASLRRSLREKGHVEITGDGTQSRDFIHVSDVVRANILAAGAPEVGTFDICTGVNWSMNEIAALIGAEVVYTDERQGDIRHIRQDPKKAERTLGFRSEVDLADGIFDSFPDVVAPA